MRLLDSDSDVLRGIATQVLPGSGHPAVERTETGVSTPVYQIRRGGVTLYLRVAEGPEASLLPEAQVHRLLHARGVRVPEVVHFDVFNEALGRSVMVTTEIRGSAIGRRHAGMDVRAVLRAAGRDLAAINEVGVEGFGWVRRDRPDGAPLAAEMPTLRAFALEALDESLAAVTGFLTAAETETIRQVLARCDAWLDGERAMLAHGDLDATHIYHRDEAYTGIIDFGEIRGADSFYDLGHVALHDGETISLPMLPSLLDGYAEVAELPTDHGRRIQLWSVLIGVRALARSVGRSPAASQDHLVRGIRLALAQLG